MITQIDVLSEQAFALPILGVTPKSSLLIKKITGLNPPDRDLFIGNYSQDGGIYQGRRVGNRNVVFTIDLNPNPALGETMQRLRQKLYKAFIDPQAEGEHLKVLLHDDEEREIYFVGYCEKFETEIFDVDTMCQISMICPDPYLRDNQDTILTSATGLVEFPFTYQGTAETGFLVRIYVTTPTQYVTLYNNGKVMKLYNPAGYTVGDIIIINTVRGQRSITVTHPTDLPVTPSEYSSTAAYAPDAFVFFEGGVWRSTASIPGGATFNTIPGGSSDYWEFVSTHIISHLSPESQWLELHSADNTMRVYQGDSFGTVVANIKYLKYTSAYWGI